MTTTNTMSTLRKTLLIVIFLIVALHLIAITFYLYPKNPISFHSHGHHDRLEPSEFAKLGRWGPSIPLPLVPVAMAILPTSGKVLLWSADNPRVFSNSTTHTLTALLDLRTGTVTPHNVTQTHHNMFCPGLSLDASGRVVITGGSSPLSTSIYDPTAEAWLEGPPLTTGRGYHSQATLSDGRIFTIGGSWSGRDTEPKNGEILSFSSSSSSESVGQWQPLPSALALPMHTLDPRGPFAADNHAWLFAWSNNSIFQAGPSRNMNWYSPDHHTPAGLRSTSPDSMNGNAVLFSASPQTGGKILTLGGAEAYSLAPATSSAYLISLPVSPFSTPSITKLPDMHHPRTYANAVILPTGDVFIVGGATYARQWTDKNATLVPEVFHADNHTFTELAPMAVARTYHSVAALLPDGAVLVGGGGLCWELCEEDESQVNHLDVQVYEPGYLFPAGGERPKILEVDNTRVRAGGRMVVCVGGRVKEFALLRYVSVTHAVNTDQRRIELDAVVLAQVGAAHVYEIQVPEDSGIAVPGYWMLFAISQTGVPSVAETILIEASANS